MHQNGAESYTVSFIDYCSMMAAMNPDSDCVLTAHRMTTIISLTSILLANLVSLLGLISDVTVTVTGRVWCR